MKIRWMVTWVEIDDGYEGCRIFDGRSEAENYAKSLEDVLLVRVQRRIEQ
jgi:hypothetical protein